MLQIYYDTAKIAVNLLEKMKENRRINGALNSTELNRNASRAQYKCEIQDCRWTSNENLLPHLPVSGDIWIQPPPPWFFICPLIQSCVICRRWQMLHKSKLAIRKHKVGSLRPKLKGELTRTPTPNYISLFSLAFTLWKPLEKLNGLKTLKLGKIQL